MFTWAKQQLANVIGTEEPEYGPSAVRTVVAQCKEKAHTELMSNHLEWKLMSSTSVETQTFYVITEAGHIIMAQVIYSNVAKRGLRVVCQFNVKVHYANENLEPLWTTDSLENWKFDKTKRSLSANKCTVQLKEDGSAYIIKSNVNSESTLDLKISKAAPGFMAGKDGTTYFGTDQNNPWGSMHHAFWPRCDAEGSLITKNGPIALKGKGSFVHALQGMKPHHAAARWNFAIHHSETYSFMLMEFTTPPSYGSTTVSVGGLAIDGEIVIAGPAAKVTHDESTKDQLNHWPEPMAATYQLDGMTKEGKAVSVKISGKIKNLDRVDVMAEVPGFVKDIVAGTVGTKPYIYQYGPVIPIKVEIGGKSVIEEGRLFAEATFVS